MFDTQFYTTLVSLAVAVIVICNFNHQKEEIEEGFLPGLNRRVVSTKHNFTNSLNKGDVYKDFGQRQTIIQQRSADLKPSSSIASSVAVRIAANSAA